MNRIEQVINVINFDAVRASPHPTEQKAIGNQYDHVVGSRTTKGLLNHFIRFGRQGVTTLPFLFNVGVL